MHKKAFKATEINSKLRHETNNPGKESRIGVRVCPTDGIAEIM